MHVDLWMSGKILDEEGRILKLMNCMYNLTQVVISIIVKEDNYTKVGKLFMEQVVLSFDMEAVVVVDADSKFLNFFKDTCKRLNINVWPLSRGNHKGMSVEHYHRFLNKTQTINGEDRGLHHTFIENSKTSQYVWNSAPIDDTDIPRCVAEVGRHFKFPMDVQLNKTPELNDADHSELYDYLRDVSIDSTFVTSVLQVLIKERRTAHRDRWNTQ